MYHSSCSNLRQDLLESCSFDSNYLSYEIDSAQMQIITVTNLIIFARDEPERFA